MLRLSAHEITAHTKKHSKRSQGKGAKRKHRVTHATKQTSQKLSAETDNTISLLLISTILDWKIHQRTYFQRGHNMRAFNDPRMSSGATLSNSIIDRNNCHTPTRVKVECHPTHHTAIKYECFMPLVQVLVISSIHEKSLLQLIATVSCLCA